MASLALLGWSLTPGDAHAIPGSVTAWLAKLLGLLRTIVGVSLGASFWFDALKGLINLRSSGEKPEAAFLTNPPPRPGPA